MTQIKKIEYRCVRNPEVANLKGFLKGKVYRGRSFNGFYEISMEWASHHPTLLLDQKEFEKYFELVEIREKQEI